MARPPNLHFSEWLHTPEADRRYRRWITAIISAVFIGSALVLWIFRGHGEREALRQMDPLERRALLEETRRYTGALCTRAETESALGERCVHAARFVLTFPECDEACRDQTNAYIDDAR